ncbi:hypothetical protein EV193_104142 [Herbihabitans rhizosphaerae]|uniref:DUF308 domain-containing protein n=1 Tax=Herbihabitans rhizosphaerae TaxID=1872711 RepID=A0A4Q7KT15_9PSEU|nr:hypothetical protein [Herbihabitans rhizosphaerae]RZS38931.1 hypothetical protein EV193_104142 [Herbihabitans rhizosphaerae]
MKGTSGGKDGPEDVDAAFAEIVADLEAQGVGTGERDKDDGGDDEKSKGDQEPREAAPTAPSSSWRAHQTEYDPSWTPYDDDDEHYVPPEPPPLPSLRPITILAIVLLGIGLLLLAVPSVIGLPTKIATPISLVAFASGAGLLVLRMRQRPPGGPDDGDDGAQV